MTNEVKIGDIVHYVDEKKNRGIITKQERNRRLINVYWFKDKKNMVNFYNEVKKVENDK